MNIKEFADRMKAVISDTLKKEVQIVNPLKLNNVRHYGLVIMEPVPQFIWNRFLKGFWIRITGQGL